MQTFTAIEYLKIDIANNYGKTEDGLDLDKEDWDVRIAWFNVNEHKLDKLLKTADNPALFFAGVRAYKDARAGKPSGYPVSLDATSSGIQLLSILIGCRKSAEQCNVVNVGKRQDAYNNNYANMIRIIQDGEKIGRKKTKQALMTAFYGSKAVPRETFGEGTALLEAFYKSVKELFPGAWLLNESMLGTWQPNALSHNWVLPDNFHVKIKVMDVVKRTVHFRNQPHDVRISVNKPTEEGLSNGANAIHSVDGMVVREVRNRCSFDPDRLAHVQKALIHTGKSMKRKEDKMVMILWDHYTKSGFLSTRILNYLDSMNMGLVDAKKIEAMLASFPKKPFHVLAVHDCFRCLPKYANDLRMQYNQVLADLARSDLLKYIVSQIMGHSITVNKMGDFADEILESDYALS